MKKKSLLVTIILLLIAVFAFSLTACNNEVGTLESLQNEYGIVVDGGSFKEGSTLVSNEIVATTEEGAEVLTAIADKNYNKDGSVYIFDIYVTKDGAKVQPNGKVKITIPNPGITSSNCIVFHIKTDNSVEEIIPAVSDSAITFETSSFSYFVLAEKNECIHSLDRWMVAEEATCIKEGLQTRKCMLCGEVILSKTYLADHEYGELIPEVSPTLFEEGVIAHYECTTCGGIFNESKEAVTSTSIEKVVPEISIYLDGEAVAEFTVDETTSGTISLSIADLEVTEGQLVTIRDTANAEVIYEYTVSEKQLSSLGIVAGNIDPTSHKVRTTSTSNVGLVIGKNSGYTLTMDGYKHSGVVIEITSSRSEGVPVLFPMSKVEYYGDPDTQAYVFGLFGSDRTTSFRIIDLDTNTVYDYDDISPSMSWNAWTYSKGEGGEIVFADQLADWWIAFDIGGDGKITPRLFNLPMTAGETTLGIYRGSTLSESISMEKVVLEVGSEEYNHYTWALNNAAFNRTENWLDRIDPEKLFVYRTVIEVERNQEVSVKWGSTTMYGTYLSEVIAPDGAIGKAPTSNRIRFDAAGKYVVEYVPFCNVINIFEMDLGGGYNMYLDGAFIPLEADGSGILTYEGLEATKSTNIAFFTSAYSAMPLTLSDSSDASVAHTLTTDGMSSLFFDKAGKFNLSYDTKTGILTIEVVELEEDGGSENGSIDDYLIFLSVVDYTNGNQTLYFTQNPDNENEVYVRVETMAANSYISVGVMEKGGDYSTTSYGTLADTDSSIATNLTAELINVKVAGPIDVYFNFETKTVKIVAVSGPTEETVLPKDIYISTMEKYTFIENPDNSDELCYLGLVLESYDDFRIRDTDNNYISDITLASGTTGVYTNGSSVMVQADGTYNIYINKTTHEVRIVVVS